ncbi:type II secretion system F family protein [Roseobacter ponti]|uniref:Type II secretion system F family protein n=1 Tax=Roseobacter ponti TaxID=1891787 RepID=A0A858SSW9_9RHOB|nr:type II secretion system F family protein [Roseobacter ponti]QJF51804.1 type II secretion system F family protein [Roseobacter ponti]
MFDAFLTSFGLDTTSFLLLCGVGVGSLVAVFGIGKAMTDRTPAAERIAANSKGPAVTYKSDLIKLAQAEPTGLVGAFSPKSDGERFQVTKALASAGFRGPGAVANFYLIRIVLAVGLPGTLALLIALANAGVPWLPGSISGMLGSASTLHLVVALAMLTTLGFYGPSAWLKGRINERKRKIEEAFPNALDLLQIAVEAGLGFDAAMTRVATEIHSVAPDIAEELLIAQSEIQAGRDRDRALLNMGQRTGVEEVMSFANVVLQSIQFGTSVADALTVYATEMRLTRELKAQEKANKLPVQMSAVMASLMLPAILMLSLGPVVIRYVNYFAAN